MWWLWFSHGHLEDGGAAAQRALAIDGTPTPQRVRALRAASHLSWWRGEYRQAARHNEELLACAEAIDDDWGRAWAPMAFGAVEMFLDSRRALEHLEESRRRFESLGRQWEAAYALQVIGGARWFAGDEQGAGAAFDEAVEIFEAIGQSSVLASARRNAGLMAAICGNPARGTALCTAALTLSNALHDRAGSAQALNFLAAIHRDEGDRASALACHAQALRLAREVGELWATCWALDGIAGAALAAGEPETAARLQACSGRHAARAGYRPPPREHAIRDADARELRRALDATDFERAAVEGDLMTVGEAVACALAFADLQSSPAVRTAG
jgi:tetratricopeptide (TPR) repeat protein